MNFFVDFCHTRMLSLLLLLNLELLCHVVDFCETPKRRRLILQTLSLVNKSLRDTSRVDALWKPVVADALPQVPNKGYYRAAVAYGKELATLYPSPCPQYKVTLEVPDYVKSTGRLISSKDQGYCVYGSEVFIPTSTEQPFPDPLRITLMDKTTLEERTWECGDTEDCHVSSHFLTERYGGSKDLFKVRDRHPEVFESNHTLGVLFGGGTVWDGVDEHYMMAWVDCNVENGVKTLRNLRIEWTGNHTCEEVMQLLWEGKERPIPEYSDSEDEDNV